MDLTKHSEFFNIHDINAPIHILGIGAVGSTIAEMLCRMGVQHLNLYDIDIVDAHNIPNQMYRGIDIKKTKLRALSEILQDINPDIQLTLYEKGYTNQSLSGYIFLAIDNADIVRSIVEDNLYNSNIIGMFDFRIRLTDAQHYAANWSDLKSKQDLLATMQFTHEEAKAASPVSACGSTLNIITTIRVIIGLGLSNFINFVKRKELKKIILIDAFNFTFDVF